MYSNHLFVLLQLLLYYCLEWTTACKTQRHTAVINKEPWTLWSAWSACSNTACGHGVRSRVRTNLMNPTQKDFDKSKCYSTTTCIYGTWDEWQAWSSCDKSCNGQQTRAKNCNRPPEAEDCRSPIPTEIRSCNLPPCVEVVPQWLEWLDWSACISSSSIICGGFGTRIRTRKCDMTSSDIKTRGFIKCIGNSSDEDVCALPDCRQDDSTTTMSTTPVTGTWSNWSLWSLCSVSCGSGGTQNRQRTCPNKVQGCGSNINTESRPCPSQPSCVIIPNWSSWTLWSLCSSSCGPGRHQRNRFRDCPTNISPSECTPVDTQSADCQVTSCPSVHGQWGSWQSWSICMATCGYSQRTRMRFCDSPTPQHGGDTCQGPSVDSEKCLGGHCPVDGAWGSWGVCDDDSKDQCLTSTGGCTAGQNKQCRNCDDPKPQFNGENCFTGSSVRYLDCWNRVACDNTKVISPLNMKVIGTLGSNILTVEWQRAPYGLNITDFVVKFGVDVFTTLVVSVNESQPLGGAYRTVIDKFTVGQLVQVIVTSRHLTPEGNYYQSDPVSQSFRVSRVDGQYGEWGPWTICDQSCGFGWKNRQRQCDSPPPTNGGIDCVGDATESARCKIRSC